MQLRSLQTSDIPQCKNLWKERFQDSDSFLDFYFTNYFQPSFSFGIFENETLISAAYGRDYFLRFGKTIFQGIMIGGVATKIGFEGHHYSHAAIREIMKAAETEEYSFLCLCPINEKIYSSLGFYTVSYAWNHFVQNTGKTSSAVLPDVNVLLSIYSEFGKRYSVFPERFDYNMRNKINEFLSDNDTLYMYRKDSYAFVNTETNICDEIAGKNEDSIVKLLKRLPNGCKVKLPCDICTLQNAESNLMLYPIHDSISHDTTNTTIYTMDEF